jgi:hypothetical protein
VFLFESLLFKFSLCSNPFSFSFHRSVVDTALLTCLLYRYLSVSVAAVQFWIVLCLYSCSKPFGFTPAVPIFVSAFQVQFHILFQSDGCSKPLICYSASAFDDQFQILLCRHNWYKPFIFTFRCLGPDLSSNTAAWSRVLYFYYKNYNWRPLSMKNLERVRWASLADFLPLQKLPNFLLTDFRGFFASST